MALPDETVWQAVRDGRAMVAFVNVVRRWTPTKQPSVDVACPARLDPVWPPAVRAKRLTDVVVVFFAPYYFVPWCVFSKCSVGTSSKCWLTMGSF